MRRVLYISGTRADYGPARRLLFSIDAHAGLTLEVLVTGMHIDPLHGETWREIEKDGFNIVAKIESSIEADTPEAMCIEFSRMLGGMVPVIAERYPDIVLVLGDRGEALAGAMAGAYLGISVCHLCGGSISGSIDDSIRHAITKFSHYHFAMIDEHARRIIQMGEDPKNVFVVGLPGGNLYPDATLTRAEIADYLNIPISEDYLLVVQHPVTYSFDSIDAQITETLEAVASSKRLVLLGNPNNDAGGRTILARYRDYASRFPQIRMLPPSLTRQRFASILANASVLIGNSSQGIAEAMSLHKPVVNIGDRQRGREHLSKMINSGHDRVEIAAAIEKALSDESYINSVKLFQSPLIKETEILVTAKLLEIDLSAAKQAKNFFDL